MVQLYGRNLYCLTLRLINRTNQFRLSQYESDVMWCSVGCFYPTPQTVICTCAELNELPSNISTMGSLHLGHAVYIVSGHLAPSPASPVTPSVEAPTLFVEPLQVSIAIHLMLYGRCMFESPWKFNISFYAIYNFSSFETNQRKVITLNFPFDTFSAMYLDHNQHRCTFICWIHHRKDMRSTQNLRVTSGQVVRCQDCVCIYRSTFKVHLKYTV